MKIQTLVLDLINWGYYQMLSTKIRSSLAIYFVIKPGAKSPESGVKMIWHLLHVRLGYSKCQH